MPEADTGTLVVERPPADGEVKIHVQEAPGRQPKDLTDYAREAAAPRRLDPYSGWPEQA
ncbi:hypothetical protein ACH4VX_22735 [Streptomyces sp. NPDC020731]|uniref:hypothetical protein n=1 Tax=Streptomyces sp. NPDC020731 TaxID=3365085 RepID=UPI0037A85C67